MQGLKGTKRKKCCVNTHMNLYVTFSSLLIVAAIVSAYQMGRMVERPKNRWPKGGILQFGWGAWKIPLIVIIALTVLVTVLWPIVRVSGLTRAFSRPGYGRSYGGGGASYGGGGYDAYGGGGGYGAGGGYAM